jgi:hypothetical protein
MDLMWVPPDSTITFRQRDPSGDGGMIVFTRVDLEAGDLMAHFQSHSWRPRSTQWLNPRLGTSFTTGWRHQCACLVSLDDSGHIVSPRGSDEWTGEWENDDGDVIAYHLMKYYFHGARHEVQVAVQYVSVRSIHQAQRRLHLAHNPLDGSPPRPA